MLFGSGPVSETVSEYVKDYSGDVTLYTYKIIIHNLKVLGANFEAPDESLPHKERIIVLAQWLKENWKGCENLKISEVRKKITEKNLSVLEKNLPEKLT